MNPQPVDDDRLAGLTRRGYPRRPSPSHASEDVAVKLAELKLETTYVRRDLDEILETLKKGRVETIANKEAISGLRSRVESLPTFRDLITMFGAVLAIIAALVLFADRIKSLLKS